MRVLPFELGLQPSRAVAIMILLVDNYDSFTYNLVQRLGEIDPGVDLRVVRNDQLTLDEIDGRAADAT